MAACNVTDTDSNITMAQMSSMCVNGSACQSAYTAVDTTCNDGSNPTPNFCSALSCQSTIGPYMSACNVQDLSANLTNAQLSAMCSDGSPCQGAYAAVGTACDGAANPNLCSLVPCMDTMSAYMSACGVLDMNAGVTWTMIASMCATGTACQVAYSALLSCTGQPDSLSAQCTCASAITTYTGACNIASLDADLSAAQLEQVCDVQSACSAAFIQLGAVGCAGPAFGGLSFCDGQVPSCVDTERCDEPTSCTELQANFGPAGCAAACTAAERAQILSVLPLALQSCQLSLPPPATVEVSFIAAGSPEDFSPAERAALLTATARAIGFDEAPAGSTIAITAASVRIALSFPTDSATAAAVYSQAVTLASPVALQSAIGLELATIASLGGTSVSIESEGGGGLSVSSGATAATVAATSPSDDPCFPSDALVTTADGSPKRIDALRAGDAIVAATADGRLTTDTVSLLSIAEPGRRATFVVLATAAGANLTLTPSHHVPVGPSCCATLKQARHVEIGDIVYAVRASAVTGHRVAKITTVAKQGLHSPVLTYGSMPVVDGLVTAFDAMGKVTLASFGLPLLEAMGLAAAFRDAFLSSARM